MNGKEIATPFDTTHVVDWIISRDLHGRPVQFAAGAIIHQPPDPAREFYFIQSGEVHIYQVTSENSARLLDILGSGDWFGIAALAQSPTYGQRAVALTTSLIWQMPVDRVLAELERDGVRAVHYLMQTARRAQLAWSQGNGLIFEDCRKRLIKTLLRFSESPAATPAPEGVVLHMSHKQLAQAVGAARETVSVCLTELRHLNLVRTGRNRLTFDPRALRSLEQQESAAVVSVSGSDAV